MSSVDNQRLSDERLAQMLDSARRLEIPEWVSAFSELQTLRAQGITKPDDGREELWVDVGMIRDVIDAMREDNTIDTDDWQDMLAAALHSPSPRSEGDVE